MSYKTDRSTWIAAHEDVLDLNARFWEVNRLRIIANDSGDSDAVQMLVNLLNELGEEADRREYEAREMHFRLRTSYPVRYRLDRTIPKLR